MVRRGVSVIWRKRRPVVLGIVLTALIVGLAGLAIDDSFWRGTSANQWLTVRELRRELDAAAVEQGRMEYGLAVCQQELQRCGQQMESMVPIGVVIWCEGMPAPPEKVQSLVIHTVRFVKSLDSDIEPTVCVYIGSKLFSQAKGEIYVLASRNYSGGSSDRLVVYFEAIPGESGKFQITGYYDVMERTWHPVEAETEE